MVMISMELMAEIRRLYYAEHWKVGTIASELGLHHTTVNRAVGLLERSCSRQPRRTKTQPYEEFLRQTLEKHPRLRATRLFDMIRGRGYTGGIAQLRRLVRRLRPRSTEVYARVQVFSGEQWQVDWGHFGLVRIGRATAATELLQLTLSYSRALYLEFFFDQSLENFITGHVRALHELGGCPRVLLYDNLKAAVVARLADRVRFNAKLLELLCSLPLSTSGLYPGPPERKRASRKIHPLYS